LINTKCHKKKEGNKYGRKEGRNMEEKEKPKSPNTFTQNQLVYLNRSILRVLSNFSSPKMST